uniref:Uncharacterized protein n=1 Tax=Arundo donax TaxID=35708 RepID=A0A0A9E682_ARUDO
MVFRIFYTRVQCGSTRNASYVGVQSGIFIVVLLDCLLLFIMKAGCQMLRFCSCISYSFRLHTVISYCRIMT